ncbi:MAG: hypothetical protein BTN85_0787 [Candidatus Methanohalarchaeum thermophilum]|uniref:Uncharacterized protein n=1 Tax=Methanohalarchaeum thermophilum TaxID=1903181 RepID=A0A1Q6DVA0_METT1|nr:MAG: hypothetical protein BTN85_0787 [Candidatus Methanohalarchaeum thermophilum]
MSEVKYIKKDKEGLEEIKVGKEDSIKCPVFIPEIKSSEDLYPLLNHRNFLENKNPIMVPGYKWQKIRTKEEFTDRKDEIKKLMKDHPLLYYEPPELFRYKRPSNLITYSLRGSRAKRRDFNKEIKNKNIDDAIEILPEFFQPFVECQLNRVLEIMEDKYDESLEEEKLERWDKPIAQAWTDERVNKGWQEYFFTLAKDASKMPNANLIPPSPPLLKSSKLINKENRVLADLKRIRGVNRAMMNITEKVGGELSSYFHLYIDYGIFKPNSNVSLRKLQEKIEKEIQVNSYAGIALTISNYSKVWKNDLVKRLGNFITSIVNIAKENYLPVILPRSKWYGEYLTDYGVNGFSSLMNGHYRYSQRSTGGIGEKARYGKVPVIELANEYNIEKIQRFLKEYGELPNIESLPSKPEWNPDGGSLTEKFGNPKQFRIHFGKARRLSHVEEASRLRESIKDGNLSPAKRYLEKSDHPELSNKN